MPFTDNQLKGNWGEQYVSSKLSAHGVLVRHVPQGNDSGIDLYCETIVKGEPFLHFWVQVKVKKKYSSKKKDNIYRSSKKDEFNYYRKQPIPVFIFLVPDERDKEPPVFVCYTEHPIRDKNKVKSKPYLQSIFKIRSFEEYDDFLNNSLRVLTFSWNLSQGKVAPIPELRPSYLKYYFPEFSFFYKEELKTTIMDTLYLLGEGLLLKKFNLIDLSEKNNSFSKKEIIEQANVFVNTLEFFIKEINDKHYHNYKTVGIFAELKKDFKKALIFYQDSIKILNDDQDFKKGYNDICLKSELDNHIKRVTKHLTNILS